VPNLLLLSLNSHVIAYFLWFDLFGDLGQTSNFLNRFFVVQGVKVLVSSLRFGMLAVDFTFGSAMGKLFFLLDFFNRFVKIVLSFDLCCGVDMAGGLFPFE